MRALISGEVVDTDRNEWNFSGRQGVAYTLFVRAEGDSPGQAAARVKCSAEQFGTFSNGDVLKLAPVDVFANTVERSGVITGAKLSVSLDEKYTHQKQGKPLHATG